MANKKNQLKHTHKIMRSGPVWKCILDGCRFFVYHTQSYILPGRNTICWQCDVEFVITQETLDMIGNPLCISCQNPELDIWDEASTQIANKNLSTYKEPKEPTEH